MTTLKINILVIGAGGREHAMVRALKRSASTGTLACSPGNDGIAQDAPCVSLPTLADVIAYVREHDIQLVVIGPEQPLVDGWADGLRAAGIKVFGPSAKAAQIEASKDFTKRLCDRYRIPTARYATFHDAVSATAYVNTIGAPLVIKADGLAAGKGVTIAMTVGEAEDAIAACFEGAFGAAGHTVVVEEFLEGEEVSFFALSDGNSVRAFGSAQDHKRAFDGDTGPNTGGMGTYSPAPIFTPALEEQVMREIVLPAAEGLASEGMPYIGVFFAGLMLTKQGPKLIEFNCRFGDPETQALMARFTGDLAALFYDCAAGTLGNDAARFSDEAALCIVYAAKGYPASYKTGTVIRKLDHASQIEGVHVLHAGTKKIGGQWEAHGGRVLNIVGTGTSLKDAHARAYRAIKAIDWPEGFFRNDIGWRALK